MIELDFYINLFSMELQSFEKPYVALLNSANTAYNQPLGLQLLSPAEEHDSWHR
jgi:hypothetical protein